MPLMPDHTPTQPPVTPVTVWGTPIIPPQNWAQVPDLSTVFTSSQSTRSDPAVQGQQKEEEKKRREDERDHGTSSSSTQVPSTAEATRPVQAGGNRSRPPHPSQEAQDDIVILTTRYGKVHHKSHECDYIRAPHTGVVRRSRLCAACGSQRPTGTFVAWCNSWGSEAHTNRACPGLSAAPFRYTPCSRCNQG